MQQCMKVHFITVRTWRDFVGCTCMQLQHTRSRVSCHCENLLFMHVYLLEWVGYHSSLRFVTPLEVRGEGT